MTSLTGATGGQFFSGRGTRGGGQGDVIPSGYRAAQLQQYDPQQMDVYRRGFESVAPDSYTSRLARGDESLFGEIEAPAMRQFSELQGNLASRFSGMGQGARRSSGFQNTMGSAASNFAQDLQSQRQGLQRQAIQDLLGMSESLLGRRPQERFISQKRPKKRSFLEEFGLAAAPGFGEAVGSGLTGGFGSLGKMANQGLTGWALQGGM